MPVNIVIPSSDEVIVLFVGLTLPLLLLVTVMALGIQVLRSRLYGYRFYRPFLLNVCLAWVPFVLAIASYLAFANDNWRVTWWVAGYTVVFFVFFPNSIYLITEVHHFRDESRVPLWFDTIAILSLVLCGLLLGGYSLVIMQFLLQLTLGAVGSWVVLIGYVLLSNFGIYVGRYLRFNSWDVLRRPGTLVRAVWEECATGAKRRDLALYVALFSGFLLANYLFIHTALVLLQQAAREIDILQGVASP